MEETCGIFSNANFWCVVSNIFETIINNLYVNGRFPNNMIQECMKVHGIISFTLNL